MRTNVDLDNTLLLEAMEITGLPSKSATIEEALREMVRNRKRREGIRDLFGIGWEGNLDEMRQGRFFDHEETK